MRYILDDRYYLCGWKKLPFAMMDSATKKSFFFTEPKFHFLFDCSGKKDINTAKMSQELKDFADELLKQGVIREAQDGEMRTLTYTEYPGIYKSSVQWSITGKCDYCCKHCYQSAPEGVLGEPTLEQCMDIVAQLDACGIKKVSLIGGEPLIRPDFLQIVDEILRRDMLVTAICTNGKLVTQELLDGLKARNARPEFQIGFDGVGYHDWMRGVEGAEEVALGAIRLLRQNGFHVSCAMTLCKDNVGSIRDTVKVLAEAGCESLKLQRAMPQGAWAGQEEHSLAADEVFQAYVDYIPQFAEDGCPLSIQMEGFFSYDKPSNTYSVVADKAGVTPETVGKRTPCGIVHNTLCIGPNGAVTPCMSMCGTEIEAQFPNIFKTPLRSILRSSSYTQTTLKRVDHILANTSECAECDYRYRCCGGCRASAVGATGNDYFAKDPVACEMFRGGWVDCCYDLADQYFQRAGACDQEGAENPDGPENPENLAGSQAC